jgi:glucosamine--fructose-6-phosphate aminotransferase (isomerizing)
VLVDNKTLVLAALTPGDVGLQDALLHDIKKRGATLVVFSDRAVAPPHADYCVSVPSEKSFAAQGVPFVFLSQALSLFKALGNGIDPDKPAGLDPWINLGGTKAKP